MSQLSVAIVGGGLVGALEACLLAKRGLQVTLFEARHDGRNEPTYYGRSINLAISVRGISALERLGLDHIVRDRAIPMEARMIHDKKGHLTKIPYDPNGRCINSIERAGLNNFLLDKAEKEFGIKVLFNHKLVDMNADKGELFFRLRDEREWSSMGHEKDEKTENNLELIRYTFDLILGCDGSRSTVRSLLARQTKMELSQTYIEHGYMELRMDPNERDNSFKMDPNYLHIWPRGNYMMIALPNKDSSFTCTLFMPYALLKSIYEPNQGLEFFRNNFADSVDLIGAQRIKETLASVQASPLISIKCNPYVYKGKVALLGDSAHAMVPFYGQGMNCGFEDCLVLDELLDKHSIPGQVLSQDQINRALEDYDKQRCANGHSMCDLAMYNYIEMRDLVNTWSFRFRKYLDNTLYYLFPNSWIPLYTMVTFSRIPVDECVRRRARQDEVIAKLIRFGFSCALLSVGATSVLLLRTRLR